MQTPPSSRPAVPRFAGSWRVCLPGLLAAAAVGCRPDPVGVAPTLPVPADQVRTDRAPEAGDTIPDQWIVVLRPSAADAPRHALRLTRVHRGVVRATFARAIRGFAARLPASEVAALRADPDVVSVEPDRVVRVTDVQLSAPWGLDRIDQPALPLNGTYSYAGGSTGGGAGVNVYVLDTGIYPAHTEFGGRAAGAYDGVGDGYGTGDCYGHGTHVAGTIGGATVGVAKQVRLWGVRVLDCEGSGFSSDVIAGIDWVMQHGARPAVINMSLSGGSSPALNAAAAAAVASGITVVVAAGNQAQNACDASPAAEPSTITVGATGSNDAEASFSNYGRCVDLYAPGVSVRSARSTGPTSYRTMSGTSMAAPHVAGAAALVLGADSWATPAEVTQAIVSRAAAGVVRGLGTGSPNRLLQTTGLATPPPVARVSVGALAIASRTPLSLTVGESAQFTAQAFRASGALINLMTRGVRYASTAPAVASVDSLTGVARARAPRPVAVAARGGRVGLGLRTRGFGEAGQGAGHQRGAEQPAVQQPS